MIEVVIAVSVVLIVLSAAAALMLGRYVFPRATVSRDDSQELKISLATAAEREKGLTSELASEKERNARVVAELEGVRNASDIAKSEHAADREKLTAAEANLRNVQHALESEQTSRKSTDAALRLELSGATAEINRLNVGLGEANQKIAATAQMESELRERIGRAENYISERDAKVALLETQLSEHRAAVAQVRQDLAASAERESALNRTLIERDEQLKGLQEKLKLEFENIANNVLGNATSQLNEASNKSLKTILEPLGAKIVDFEKRIADTHTEDTKQRTSLESQIRQIALAGQAIGTQADNLARALKGDAQVRGRWGEMKLERILEASQLERNRDFFLQGDGFNFRSEDGGHQRPDVVIRLPEGRHFIIDSKVTLIHYETYVASETDEGRAESLKKLLQSVKTHVDGLAGKQYQLSGVSVSHDLVLMFMPVEGAMALVLQHGDEIFDYAWNKKIVLVSPSTLFMTLRTVESIWRYERQNENAVDIAKQAGSLYDKLVGVVDDLNTVSDRIQSAAHAHNEAMKKLGSGRGNVLGRAEKLKSLGVKPKKGLPQIWIDGERQLIEDNDEGLNAVKTVTLADLAETEGPDE